MGEKKSCLECCRKYSTFWHLSNNFLLLFVLAYFESFYCVLFAVIWSGVRKFLDWSWKKYRLTVFYFGHHPLWNGPMVSSTSQKHCWSPFPEDHPVPPVILFRFHLWCWSGAPFRCSFRGTEQDHKVLGFIACDSPRMKDVSSLAISWNSRHHCFWFSIKNWCIIRLYVKISYQITCLISIMWESW